MPLLSVIIFLPTLGALAILAWRREPRWCRRLALAVTLADLFLVLSLLGMKVKGDAVSSGRWLLWENRAWIDGLGVRYSLGLDGVSWVLIFLTTLLGVLCVIISWEEIEERVALFHCFLLLTQTGILGVFLAEDLLLFYLFWEFQVIPMFFIIGMWGHGQRRHATVKFFLFTAAASLPMLFAVIGIYSMHGAHAGHYTFSLLELTRVPLSGWREAGLFAAFLLAFGVKIPMIPVHTWLPDAHTAAPTAGSVILAGLLLKTGTYALLRIAFPLFPAAAHTAAPLLALVGLIALLYAAWIALAQLDIKRLVAYSSVAHMGLVVIGIALWNPLTLSGAVLQMVNHGMTTSALFILVGMLDRRLQTRSFTDLGGLWHAMPNFAGFFLLFALASIGLPGLNNFIGEILILIGALGKQPTIAVVAFGGLVLTVVYGLKMVQATLFGAGRERPVLEDITPRETLVLLVLAAAVLWIGLAPGALLQFLQAPVSQLLENGALPPLDRHWH
jgi:NADH-quinone oxidoreductase subunit M